MMGLPGKKGRPRKKLGFMERSESDRSISIVLLQKNIETLSFTTGKRIQIHARDPEDFSDSLFRRALHHVAFNSLALIEGCSHMQDKIFDSARKYVRQPKKGEVWPMFKDFLANISIILKHSQCGILPV